MKITPAMNQRPDPIPLTQEKYDQLHTQQQKLLTEQEAVLIRLNTAREQGDLSENGAYKYAKFELGNVRRELRRINYLLRWGVVTHRSSQSTQIDFGAQVTLKNAHNELSFTLVSEHESNPADKKLSTKSPFGAAVLGKSQGDTVVVKAPNGETSYTITKVV